MWAALLLFSILVPQAEVFFVNGRIRSLSDRPLEGATITLVDTGETTVSDGSGSFRLAVGSFPARFRVAREGFVTQFTVLTAPPESSIVFTMHQVERFSEEITVTASAPDREFAPKSSASSSVTPDLPADPPQNLADVVDKIPGVALNGQGGLFQSYSIRGISGHRIQASIAGARLTSERRAGASGSFIDPFLVSNVNVLRGSAGTYHGSGALGGVVDTAPKHFQSASGSLFYSSNNREDLVAGGWGIEHFSLGAARRSAGNGTAADGTLLNTHFTQYSATLHGNWSDSRGQYELWMIPSFGSNIGKASNDYPFRTADYPEENHLLGSFRMRSTQLWSLEAFVHPHRLETASREADSTARVSSDTVDYGLRFNQQFHLGPGLLFDAGLDYFARRSVDSLEESSRAGMADEVFQALAGASEDELGFKASAVSYIGALMVEGGGRFSLLTQSNRGFEGVRGTGWSGFAGLAWPLAEQLELTSSVGTGLRFPTLSERFFSGTTGRGQAVANTSLDAERSINVDGGLRWFSDRFFTSVALFRNRISDYIEQIEISNDTQTFVNLTRGTIRGLEWELVATPNAAWALFARGHWMRGHDASGDPLADIPMTQATLGGRRSTPRWSTGFEFTRRAGKEEPGSGEMRIKGTGLLSAFVSLRVRTGLELTLAGSNFTNADYYVTADRKSPLALGRSVRVTLQLFED